MKFRRAKQQQGVTTRFPALLYPLGNWICLLFMAAVLVIMLITRYGDFRLPDRYGLQYSALAISSVRKAVMP